MQLGGFQLSSVHKYEGGMSLSGARDSVKDEPYHAVVANGSFGASSTTQIEVHQGVLYSTRVRLRIGHRRQ